jgi:hypothetical protein
MSEGKQKMSAVICPHCSVANCAFDTLCHCCSGRLPAVPGVQRLQGMIREAPPPQVMLQKQRAARWTARILIGAAGMCALRGVIYPILIQQGGVRTFGRVNVDELRMVSYALAVALFAISIWARKTPLIASVAAMMLYLATAIPEAIVGEGLIGRGLISKGVMVLILGLAIMSGLYHNMMSR